MQQINKADPANLSPETIKLLDDVQASMGMVPNIIATMANSKMLLELYLGMSGTLGKSQVSSRMAEQIALTVAGTNQCDYCASAHSVLGAMAGLDQDEIDQNLHGNATDSKAKLVLDFVNAIVRNKGHVSENSLSLMRNNGFSDEEMLEIFGHVMLNIFTNYFNHLVGTEIDFPVVNSQGAAAA